MKTRALIITVVIAAFSSIFSVWVYAQFIQSTNKEIIINEQNGVQTQMVGLSGERADFTTIASNSINAVVHVKTKYAANYGGATIYDFLFGYQGGAMQPMEASGSGVIIQSEGYIVTNNHVIENSNEIEVVLNDKRTFTAKLIGTDPTTDLALLKIEAEDLPIISYGNSDDLLVGEWVLAVGNPFNLTSTVTAGIVSAKGRNINLLSNKFAIESFIQTDAAVNPGNSGGALVDSRGLLVGINTAIASQTGSYAGYSFAVPVNIVKKVVSDLIEFGSVQRALLGVSIRDIDGAMAEQLDLDKIEGVFVAALEATGAAAEAGMKEGDIILQINGVKTNNVAELQEQVSKYRPGVEIKIIVKRDSKELEFNVVLKNKNGTTDVISTEIVDVLGAEFETLSNAEKSSLHIENGIKVVNLAPGKLMKVGIRPGFIIIRMNQKLVKEVSDINDILNSAEGGVMIEGIYPNGETAYYAFGVR